MQRQQTLILHSSNNTSVVNEEKGVIIFLRNKAI